ncbi:hypothetical protein FOMG_16854 [Fusarium oxysporum f. sp. melonis 26406]|uniref:DUF7082 domain-containing protein n=1 Tax=Fusarium oxysporum f. sp. melonis 26406 TaxID=1089452 RepID=W9Z441_FUSOX|nr:hypothetical protein FOMG_16854 [Fusarium oxysporum f. sp. melonis 26406]
MKISIKTEPSSIHTGYAQYQGAGEQHSSQTYPTRQQFDMFAHLNQQSFTSNSAAVAQYMPSSPIVLSCQPATGTFCTKVYVKLLSQYDLFSLSTPIPTLSLVFGYEKCSAQDVTVPLSLVFDGPSGEEISRIPVGTFQYLEGSRDDCTTSTKMSKHEDAAPVTTIDQPSTSPKAEPQLPSEPGTNTYEYPPQQGQYANTLPQANNEMRRPTAGRSPYSSTLGSTKRGPGGLDTSLVGRPPLTPLGIPSPPNSNGAPQLVRTSTITANAGNNTSYHPISLYSGKAVLKISGKLESMAENWTSEEWANRRRILLFRKTQKGSTVNATCQSGECYVTSVDTIHLLEQLVAAPNRFSVEEKNRIRRNLEGFHPQTVHKAKPDSEEFFKIIMGFPNPKPRNIEKDVKVFPWKILESALKKIIGKYSVDPSTPATPPMVSQPSGGYTPLPTPPGQSMAPAHPDAHTQYSLPQHHNSIPSSRLLSSPQSS